MKTLKNVESMYKDYESGSIVVLNGPVSVDSLKSFIADAMDDVVAVLKSVTPGSSSTLVSDSKKYGHGLAEESKDSFSRQMVEPKHQGTKSDPNAVGTEEGAWDRQRQSRKEREERGETPEKGWKKASVSAEDAAGIVETVLAIKGYVADIHNKKFGSKVSGKQWDAMSAAEDETDAPHSDVPMKRKDGTVTEAKTRVPDGTGSEKVMKPKDFKRGVSARDVELDADDDDDLKKIREKDRKEEGKAEKSTDKYGKKWTPSPPSPELDAYDKKMEAEKRAISDKATAEGRSMTKEETDKYQKAHMD